MELDQTLVDYLVTALEEEDVLFTHYWVVELREKGQLPQALEQTRTFSVHQQQSELRLRGEYRLMEELDTTRNGCFSSSFAIFETQPRNDLAEWSEDLDVCWREGEGSKECRSATHHGRLDEESL